MDIYGISSSQLTNSMIFQRGGEKTPTSNLRIFVDHCWMVLAHQKQKKDVATAVDISQVLMSAARLAQLLKRFKSFGAMVGAEKKPHMGHISHRIYRIHGAGIYANIDPINIPQSCQQYTSTSRIRHGYGTWKQIETYRKS